MLVLNQTNKQMNKQTRAGEVLFTWWASIKQANKQTDIKEQMPRDAGQTKVTTLSGPHWIEPGSTA